MSLFLNTSSLYNHYLDCCTLDVSETIERDCLSVLHKLHDQVNGLQLVQVVVQPLARLFNPASLAALVANVPPSIGNISQNVSSSGSNTATTPTSQHHTSSGLHHDLDGTSTTSISSTNMGTTSHNNSHSRSQSFASAYNAGNNSNNSLMSSASTYMMSPDTAQALIARLDTDRDVNWLMEIIGYGLSMPFSLTGEQDSVKDCCTIYCEWLAAALLPYNEQNEDSKYQQLSKLVPVPIRKDPNRYARKMLSHLYNVFLPRHSLGASNNQKDQSDAILTAVSRQAVLCHRVLRTIESIAQNQANLMDNQTWDHLLALLLSVNDKLLSGPTEPDDIGTQLHDRILGVLFELMLLASAQSLLTSSLWKTFHEMCLHWRHRPALVDHWRRITLLLTKRLVIMPTITTKSRPENELGDQAMGQVLHTNLNAVESAIASMDYKSLSQTWYRFLNLVGNPVELSDPNIISRTDEFYHSACSSDNVLDPRQHPCLNALPQIFMNSMLGLRDFIDTFLGSFQQSSEEQTINEMPPSFNQSKRGSIVSLNSPSLTSTLVQPTTITQQQSSHPPNLQPQALTPTQSRKSGIKSIAMKGGKVIPFTNTNTASSGSHSSTLNPNTIDSGQNSDHSKSAISNSSRQPQFMQPRPSLTSLTSRTSQNQHQLHFKLLADRPKCNSLLHIFGDWLFSAALIGSDLNQEVTANVDCSTSEGDTSVGSSTTTEISDLRSYSPSTSSTKRTSNQKSNMSGQSVHARQQDNSGASSNLERITLDPPLTPDSFEAGQAEAMAILCKIFSSKTSTEDISPNYLSRFYLCLQHCLAFGSGQDSRHQQSSGGLSCSPIRRQLLASVLINSTLFLQKDLDGINLLIPCFIKAIEFVFECNEKEMPIQPPPRQHNRSGSIRQGNVNNYNITNYDLRRACILTLLNLLAYPFHFQDLAIRSCLIDSSPANTFKSLRPRLLKLLFVALQTENDPVNMQMLFGGLSLTIHDLASNADRLHGSKEEGPNERRKNDSTSSSVATGHDSTNNSLDTFSKQDDSTSQNSFVFNSNGGFLVKSLHVTCHLLINIWKHDTQVSLAALELLTTIARESTCSNLIENNDQSYSKSHKLNNNNNRIEMRNEYMQTTKWICDYICNQCSRPPPAHSRDMHSTIVAAYQCLSVWFYNHPYLLCDENCVRNLMEVIELGVSGQKSKTISINPTTGLTNHSIIYKNDKIMKPSSMRVREAAESLLNICMVRATTPNGSLNKVVSSYDTVLDELSLVDLFSGPHHKATIRQLQDIEVGQLEAYKLFKYFSDENSVIFALLEGSNHEPSSRDSVICLLRTAFGKHCWKMKFNYYTEKSREKIIANKALGLIKRPFQCATPTSSTHMFPFSAGNIKSIYFNNNAKFFPDTLANIPSNELDHLVTTLDDYIEENTEDPISKGNIENVGKIFSHQVLAEQKVMSDCSIRIKRIDCEEPQPSTDLDAARIFVNHLGLKTALSSKTDGDKISSSFVNDIKLLDNHPVRTCDTVNIFYVRKNRTSPKEIVESVRSRHNVSLAFFEWLLKLGQPTVVKNHSRWTGKVSSSWNNRPRRYGSDHQAPLTKNQMLTSDHGGAIFDGDRMTLYWSDMCQELAFLVPHKIEKSDSSTTQSGDHFHMPGCDTNIIICWLECPDDMPDIPSDAILAVAESGCLLENESQPLEPRLKPRDYVKYFISPMKNGLYRINLVTSFGRQWLALPLVDSMTVSKGILSGLLRESILNLCRRRRLDADSYQPPHVRRRLKLQEICNSYKISSRYETTEFYNNLFKSKTMS